MSRGDSEKPNFDDLDFSNLDPTHAELSEDSTADDLAHDEGGDDGLMGLDFAAAEPADAAPVTDPPVEAPMEFAAESQEELSANYLAPEVAPIADADFAGSDVNAADFNANPAEDAGQAGGQEMFGESEEPVAADSFAPQFEDDLPGGQEDAAPQFDDAAGEGGAVDFGGFGEAAALGAGGLAAGAAGIAALEHGEDQAGLAAENEEEPQVKTPGVFARFLTSLSESNPYTVLLGIAFGAILLACTMLLVEWWRYEFTTAKDSIKERVNRGPSAAVQYVEAVAGEVRAG